MNNDELVEERKDCDDLDAYNETENEKENQLNKRAFNLLKEWLEMTNKDEQFTYEELTVLCKKQEEHIKELEDKIYGTLSDGGECLQEPDYEELIVERDDLNHQLSVLTNEINALRWSLTMAYQEMTAWRNRSKKWEEDYYKEHKRAEKLYDKLYEK